MSNILFYLYPSYYLLITSIMKFVQAVVKIIRTNRLLEVVIILWWCWILYIWIFYASLYAFSHQTETKIFYCTFRHYRSFCTSTYNYGYTSASLRPWHQLDDVPTKSWSSRIVVLALIGFKVFAFLRNDIEM
jgi:energy-coupling factor transporter transmembrane protein EcfT